MNSKFHFILDLQVSQSQISIPVLQGDTAREWYISLSDGGKAVYLEDGILAKIEIKRPSGTFINAFCPIEHNTTVVYKFSQNENTAREVGLHDCGIILYGSDERVIGAAKFSMVVSERAINSDDINLTDDDLTVIDAIVSAEASRVVAENLRVDAETEREEAERERKTSFTSAIEAIDEKIEEIYDMLDGLATDTEVDNKIANAITTALNTEV